MEDDGSKAIRHLPSLISFSDELIGLAEDILGRDIRYSETDHLGFMALCFVSEQVEHLKSIRLLVEHGHHRDAGLIARTMMEGLCLLLWAAKDSPSRPLLWRSYACVEDFRLMKQKEAAGESIEPAQRAKINKMLKQYGNQFLTKKARKAQREGRPLPVDPYRKNWSGRPLDQICDEVQGQLLYEHIYRGMSERIHWSPRGLGTAITRDGQKVTYSGISPENAATALAVGFQALLQSLELLDEHLQLCEKRRLNQLRERYIIFHQSNSTV
jgi:hypothetical protein